MKEGHKIHMNIKNMIILLLLFVLMFGGIKLLVRLNTPDGIEKWESFLKSEENRDLDTTYEKMYNRENTYQITGGKLYFNGEDGLYQYDYANLKEKRIFGDDVTADFQIINNTIYYTKINDNADVNDLNLVCQKLDGSGKKTLEKNILDYLCVGNEIVFCRYEGDNVNVYQYPNHKLLFSVNDSDEDLYYLGDILFCWKEYVAFQGDLDLGYISAYNLKTGAWKEYFNMCNTRDEFYYKRTDVQCIEGNIFIQGVMCDSTKSSLGGEYYVDDAPENGIWKINLVTGKKEHLTQELYHGGIYVLNNKLYGIDAGKCDLIYK